MSAVGKRLRAMASNPGEASKALTCAPRRLASKASRPAPQPASRRRVPLLTRAASKTAA
jgi:hypothetical protein